MNEQVGWRGMWERLKKEAPHYAQLLPELPRLIHHALQPQRGAADSRVAEALLAEQRRTNRLLQVLAYGGLVLAVAAVAAALLRWPLA